MDIEEARKKKKELENKIADLLIEFSKETNTYVTNIDFRLYTNKKQEKIPINVTAEVLL